VGCLWQGNFLVSLNLRGHLSYLNPNNPNKPERVIQVECHHCDGISLLSDVGFISKGHNKSIESLAYHKSSNSLYTGSYDAVLTRWNEIDGSMEAVGGDGHKNSIIGMAFQGDSLFSVAIDDTIRVTPHNHDFRCV